MPVTLSPAGGDGVKTPAIRCNVLLPDSGTSIVINGSYQAPLVGSNPLGPQTVLNWTGSPLTSPGVPGSGNNYWIVQLNTSTGALTSKTSVSSIPAPDAGNIVICSQTIASTSSANPTLQGNLSFPWL